MNRVILLAMCCSPVLSNSLSAQENDTAVNKISRPHNTGGLWGTSRPPQHVRMKGWKDLTLGAGIISGRQIRYAYGADTGPVVTSATPTFYVSYKHFFFERIAFGVAVGMQTLWGNSNYKKTGLVYTFKDRSTTFALEATSVFMKKGHVTLYGRYGIGVTYIVKNYYIPDLINQYNTLPNVLFCPIAIRYGKGLAGFLEVGVGYKGVVNGGISYNFRQEKKPVQKKRH